MIEFLRFPLRLLGMAWLGGACIGLSPLAHAVTFPNQPPQVQVQARPMIMLTVGRDHQLFKEAYNDASDIDGDDSIDIGFKPSITYLGLFTSNYCYAYTGSVASISNASYFTPAALAGNLNTCNGTHWSGNWLNYMTTSRIDALRVVLYGGMRSTDTASNTILRRNYIPQDGHSWAKEYTSPAVNGYDITQYTPLSRPTAGRRHFFGNLTRLFTPPSGSALVNWASHLIDCSTTQCENLPPLMRIVENSNKRVWDWASSERPVLNEFTHGGTLSKNLTVQVQVCTSGFRQGCKAYGTSWKPVGLLQDFGEPKHAFFGLMTGSYDSNLQGGRLRKAIGTFSDEVSLSDGVFSNVDGIVKSLDSLRILSFNMDTTKKHWGLAYHSGWPAWEAIANGESYEWGNPIAEIMYEAARYISGASAATPEYLVNGRTWDNKAGLPIPPAFDKPYSSTSLAKAPWCSRASMLVISDSNNSFDSDGLPGANWGSVSSTLSGTDARTGLAAPNFHATNITNEIGRNEPSTQGLRFIAQSGTLVESAPAPKTVSNLGAVRGLPDEANSQGAYYAAAVARYAKANDLQPSLQGVQNIDTVAVAMASPQLRIQVPVSGGRKITVIPFALSVSSNEFERNDDLTKGEYAPVNQIVDYYVVSLANSDASNRNPSINNGRYEAVFQISYDGNEASGDYDMDVVVEYTVRDLGGDKVQVITKPTYQAGSSRQRMGYVVSGTTADGIYLVVQDELEGNYRSIGRRGRPGAPLPEASYYLNVPPGQTPGYCDVGSPPNSCYVLPYIGGPAGLNQASFTYTAKTSGSGVDFMKDPLWYAAKWGGFTDANDNGIPDLVGEWDGDGDGDPDNYFIVQNPTRLRSALSSAFQAIVERTKSVGSLATNNPAVTGSSLLYRSSFNTGYWSGDLSAYSMSNAGIGSTPVWRASAAMPTWSSRDVWMPTLSASAASGYNMVNLRSATWSSLPNADRNNLVSSSLLDYLRGNPKEEVRQGGLLRSRAKGLLADFIHSSPLVDPDSASVFIGGNGGMMHAFNAANGQERFAVLPREMIPRVQALSDPGYDHQYFVDGELTQGFAIKASGGKKNIFSTLGRGGKGLFSGDLGAAGTSWTHLWEYTPEGSTSANNDRDLGMMLSKPIYAVMNNGMGAVIAGNGYNSSSGSAVLYIFLLNENGTLHSVRKIDTGVASDNGLAGPAWLDSVANDDRADFIFAGDRKGNLWKFDVTSSDPANWRVALSGRPLFQAKNASSQAQPITSPVLLASNPQTSGSDIFIFFGTGQYFETADSTNTQVQSLYGIIDSTTPITGRSALRQRTIVSHGVLGGYAVRSVSTATANDMNGLRGWYLDLGSPFAGERVISRPSIVASNSLTLVVSSFYPINNDPCTPGGSGYLNFLNPWDGSRINADFIDLNRDRQITLSDRLSGAVVSSVNFNVGIPAAPLLIPTKSSNKSLGATENTLGFKDNAITTAFDERLRFLDGNAKAEAATAKLAGGCRSLSLSGLDGVASVTLKCPLIGVKGRLMWREILRD